MTAALAGPGDDLIDRLVGVRSSKPTYYAEWRRKAVSLEHAVQALHAVTTSLSVTSGGPHAVCDRLVEALVDHLGGVAAGIWFVPGRERTGVLRTTTFRTGQGRRRVDLQELAPQARQAAARVVETGGPVLGSGSLSDRLAGGRVLAVPMEYAGGVIGVLFVEWVEGDPGPELDDLVLCALGQHIAVMVENACLYRENADRSSQLRRAGRDLARARRDRLLIAERHRIARELHDNVAQYLVGIGMDLEWWRRPCAPA
ncbi:MAG: histidine kinase dimerization/phosphoacceptor domain-containing protein, partial [Actinomycetes bacterium]